MIFILKSTICSEGGDFPRIITITLFFFNPGTCSYDSRKYKVLYPLLFHCRCIHPWPCLNPSSGSSAWRAGQPLTSMLPRTSTCWLVMRAATEWSCLVWASDVISRHKESCKELRNCARDIKFVLKVKNLWLMKVILQSWNAKWYSKVPDLPLLG